MGLTQSKRTVAKREEAESALQKLLLLSADPLLGRR